METKKTKKTPIREYIARRIQDKMKEKQKEETQEEKNKKAREEYLLK